MYKIIITGIRSPAYPVSHVVCVWVYRDKAQPSVEENLNSFSPMVSSLFFIPGRQCFPPPSQMCGISQGPASSSDPPSSAIPAWWRASLHSSAGFSRLTVPTVSSCSFLFSSWCRADHACKSSLLQDQSQSPLWPTQPFGSFAIFQGPAEYISCHPQRIRKTYILMWSWRVTITLRSPEIADSAGNAKCSNQMINLNFILWTLTGNQLGAN